MQITSATWNSELRSLPVRADMLPVEVIKAGTPAISELNRQAGNTELGITIFETVVTGILDFFDAPWKSSVIRDTAELMHAEYHWLHLAELKHFAVKCKSGAYNVRKVGDYGAELFDGKVYGKLLPATLMKWLEAYAGESMFTRGEMRIGDTPKASQQTEETEEAEGNITIDQASPEVREEYRKAIEDLMNAFKNRQASIPTDSKKELARQQEMINGRQVVRFVDCLIAGQPMTSAEDVQFYENNKQMIELLLKIKKEDRHGKI